MKYSAIAKISRPDTPGVVTRTRVLSSVNEALCRPIIWVSAPAGSGKTSLVTSFLDEYQLPCLWYQVDESDADIATFFYYMGLAAESSFPEFKNPLPLLTPEYLQGIGTFTRRYFESLYSRFSRPFVIVFDNYQEVAADSDFHGVIREGLSSLPAGITSILISRGGPPSEFVRLRANNRMSFVGWEEIRFDFEEAKTLILNQKQYLFPHEVLRDIYLRTEGWAAGIVLLLERMKSETDGSAFG